MLAVIVLAGGACGVVLANVLLGLARVRLRLRMSWRWFYRDLVGLVIGATVLGGASWSPTP